MSAELLLRELERMSDAPDAVGRLRRFILELAVRGKLVLQDPADEPASGLLRRFGPSSRANLSPAALPPAEYQVPVSWRWCEVSDVGRVVGGGTPPSGRPDCFAASGTAIAWLTPADLGQQKGEKYASHGRRDLTQRGLESCGATVMPAGTVLFTSRAPIGYVAIAGNDVATNQGFKSVIPSAAVVPDYVAIFFQAFAPQINAMAPGTTFREVSGKIVAALPFPLAPLAEQHRIVAKVDELMALCDHLEAAQKERAVRRDGLRAASLHRLASSEGDGTSSAEDVRFFLHQSPRLITKPEHVAAVRQTILDLAVRGRLEPQDPTDEPVAELLARVKRQKRASAFAVTGRDWVSKFAGSAGGEFALPRGWEWSRIGTAVERVTVGFVGPMTSHYVESGIPFLRSQNVRPNRFRPEGLISISHEFHYRIRKSALTPGDVVVVRSGKVGTACVVPQHLPDANCSDLVVIKKPLALVSEFLSFYLNSLASSHVQAGTVGMALTHFNTKSVATMPIAVPPLAEQHRIVAKVDQLVAVCDELEAALASAQDGRARLLEELLHEALEGAESMGAGVGSPRRPPAARLASSVAVD